MWEYSVRTLYMENAQNLEKEFNDSGLNGWELVSINIEKGIYIFKREMIL